MNAAKQIFGDNFESGAHQNLPPEDGHENSGGAPPTTQTAGDHAIQIEQTRDIAIHQAGQDIVHGNKQVFYGLTEEKLMEELGVTRSALRNFFKILEQERVPFDDLDKKLREIAAQYTELLQRLEVIQSEDQQVVALKTQARQAIENGEFDKAETLLNQAEKRDLDAIEQLEATAKQRRLSAAETNADNARLQEIRLRYAKAAEYWLQAAKLLPEGEQRKRSLYLNEAGYDFHRIARYADALPLFEQSKAIDRAIGDKAGEGITCWNIGMIYQDQGDLAKVEEYIRRRVQIDEETGDPH